MHRVRSALIPSMAALMLLVPQVGAQQRDELDQVLRAWEKATREVKSLSCIVERETLDKALQDKSVATGFAMFLRAKAADDVNRFRIELTSVAEPKVSQKFIGKGQFLYSYEPSNKVVREFELELFRKMAWEYFGLTSLLGEIDAKQVKDRYDISLVNSNRPGPFYHYIRVRPKLPQDKRDFTEARLTLLRANYLPTQIWYHQPNGKAITWNFRDVKFDLPNGLCNAFGENVKLVNVGGYLCFPS